jgi:hypothetical protein
MHHLSGVFIQQEKEEEVEGVKMYCFSLIFINKKKIIYLAHSEEDIKNWINAFHFAVGYVDISTIYDFKVKSNFIF